jgi:L-Ala-D/L-Glu epimerase
MPELRLETKVIDLALAEPFSIAHVTWEKATNVFVKLSYGEAFGFGEVSPDDRWGETPRSVTAQLKDVDLRALQGPFDVEGLSHALPLGSARSALDIAMHDLAAKLAGVSVRELLGLGNTQPPPTCITIPITDPVTMARRAEDHRHYPAIKTKVGFDGDVEAVSAIRSVFDGRIRVDANEGWDIDTAIDRLASLDAFDIELCEQPIPKGDLEGLARITESSPIPIYADEDVGGAHDVARLVDSVDGVNLKLRKAGGIREVVKSISTARAHNLGVMIGCDLESGIAATAGASVAPLCDFVDMDGPLLLAEDPHPGVRYEDGSLELPEGPGLGIERTPW